MSLEPFQMLFSLLLTVLVGCALLAWRKRMKYLFGLLSALFMLGVWVGFSVPILVPSHPVGSTDDLTKVRFVVSGHEFHIPKAYLYYKPQWKGMDDGGDVDPTPILMTASAIDLRPISLSDKNIYKNHDTVLFDLNKNEKIELIDKRYLLPEALKTCGAEVDGYIRCKSDNSRMYILIYKKDKNIVFECLGRKAVGETSGGLCTVNLPLFDHVHITISFDHKYIKEGPAFVESVRQLAMSFYVRNLVTVY